MTFSYTPHARLRMRQRGFSARLIEAAILSPHQGRPSFKGRMVAQKHVRGKTLEVVYKRLNGQTVVITAYWVDEGA